MDNNILPEDIHLMKMARRARSFAYTPYSHFKVGAALQCEDGDIFLGCNIENAAYTPTNCAERTAFFKAISEGKRKFSKIAIVGGEEKSDGCKLCAPCGVCRQVMMEFCKTDTFEIILADGIDRYRKFTLGEMLPFGFGPEDLSAPQV